MRYGLLGHPLGHSLSPQLHSLLSALTGYKMEYDAYDIAPEALSKELARLFDLRGFNVTIPYKQEILPHLDCLDESAARYCAVNTVACTEKGTVGYNTDCIGFLRAISGLGSAIPSAIIIGAGGVGRMFAVELARMGASLTLGVRPSSIERAHTLADELSARYGVAVRAALISALEQEKERWALLVNASPSGMYPHTEECPVNSALIGRCGAVFDCVYNPVRTKLLAQAENLGVRTFGGLRMLVWQAAAAHELWYGARFDENDILRVEEKLAALL